MAAPLIIHDQRDRPDQQEIVIELAIPALPRPTRYSWS